jgi:hypothetical protein
MSFGASLYFTLNMKSEFQLYEQLKTATTIHQEIKSKHEITTQT